MTDAELEPDAAFWLERAEVRASADLYRHAAAEGRRTAT
jgi:hypothetical protein